MWIFDLKPESCIGVQQSGRAFQAEETEVQRLRDLREMGNYENLRQPVQLEQRVGEGKTAVTLQENMNGYP